MTSPAIVENDCLGETGFGEECECDFHRWIQRVNQRLLMERLADVLKMLRSDEVPEAIEVLESIVDANKPRATSTTVQ